MKRTVILGGGFGGVTVARQLRQMAPADHEIILIDQSPVFRVGAGKTWVMLGNVEPSQVTRARSELLPQGVRQVLGEITAIDPRALTVHTSGETVEADFLVIALGAKLTLGAIPGLAEVAQTFYTMDGAVRLRDELRQFTAGRIVILIPRIPIQCPPGPYEAAMLLHSHLLDDGRRPNVQLSICTVEPAPMATAGPAMGKLIVDALSARGIDFHPQKKTTEVDAARKLIRFDDGTDASFDLLIAIPPHQAPQVVRDAGLVGESGWIPVDPRALRVRALPDVPVYAIGDVAAVPLPGRFDPDVPLSLPKAGTLAEGQGAAVATQIASAVTNATATEFDGRGFCYVEMGRAEAIRADGDFFTRPNPVMHAQAPSGDLLRAKHQWVASWLTPPR